MSPHDLPAPATEGLYEDAPCGLLLTRADGTILRANRTFCRWTGHAADDLIGRRRFQDLLNMGGRIFHQTHLAPLLQMQGSVSEVKLDLLAADGTSMPVVVNAVRRVVEGNTHHEIAVFVAKDRHVYERELMLARRRAEELAAQQQEAQEQLRRADRRKDEFLAMLAHELRNPLAPISTAAQLLRAPNVSEETLRRIAGVVARQAGHLTNLVDDLLDVSRVTRGLIELDSEVLDLADVVDAAVEQSRPLLETRAHALRVFVPTDTAVQGDRTRLVQVFVNLLNNAAKYTAPGGSITLSVDVSNAEAAVHVTDSGIGIDPLLLPHVFELFSQGERTPDRSQGGLGIGLALVRSLVELHGGRVRVESDGAHRGSRFTVHLPLAAGPAHRLPVAVSRDGTPSSLSLRVVIVDDNADAAMLLAEVLSTMGHAVDVVLDGQGAIDAIETHRADVYILDIGLPGMSGHELAVRLRTRFGDAPTLIALTGYGQPHDRVLSKAAGIQHHLVKPVDMDHLVGLLANVATSRTETPALAGYGPMSSSMPSVNARPAPGSK